WWQCCFGLSRDLIWVCPGFGFTTSWVNSMKEFGVLVSCSQGVVARGSKMLIRSWSCGSSKLVGCSVRVVELVFEIVSRNKTLWELLCMVGDDRTLLHKVGSKIGFDGV
ncbi:hypothetical protein Drorol1_Dr00025838, partial [Drosera rotundifolia]